MIHGDLVLRLTADRLERVAWGVEVPGTVDAQRVEQLSHLLADGVDRLVCEPGRGRIGLGHDCRSSKTVVVDTAGGVASALGHFRRYRVSNVEIERWGEWLKWLDSEAFRPRSSGDRAPVS